MYLISNELKFKVILKYLYCMEQSIALYLIYARHFFVFEKKSPFAHPCFSFFCELVQPFEILLHHFLKAMLEHVVFFLLSGLKKLWCLYLVILDGVIVQSNILLHSSPTLDARVLSLCAWSKLVGVIFNKPLSVCWVDDIINPISLASDMALSCLVVGKSTWSEKLPSGDSKLRWSSA